MSNKLTFEEAMLKIEEIVEKLETGKASLDETVELYKDGFTLIPLGVAIQLPEGYEALIAPRSSTFKNFGVLQTNSVGVVDETYCGDNDEWKIPVIANHNTTINKGERICQFRIIEHQPELVIEYVDSLNNADRGGFGSTGTK